MKAPKTYFSTELHTSRRDLRRRLKNLFAAPRRRGVLPLACILLLVSMLGSRRPQRRQVLCPGPVQPLVGQHRGHRSGRRRGADGGRARPVRRLAH